MELVRNLACMRCNFLGDQAGWLIACSLRSVAEPVHWMDQPPFKCSCRQITAHYTQPCTVPLCQRKSFFICTNLLGILIFIWASIIESEHWISHNYFQSGGGEVCGWGAVPAFNDITVVCLLCLLFTGPWAGAVLRCRVCRILRRYVYVPVLYASVDTCSVYMFVYILCVQCYYCVLCFVYVYIF